MPRPPTIRSTLASTLLLASLGGCDGLFDVGQDIAVRLYTARHGTLTDGAYPPQTDPERRVFDTDLGWTIVLEESWVVMAGATLEACDGSTREIEFDGEALAENLEWKDLEAEHIGEVLAAPGEYCAVHVRYAPYSRSEEVVPADSMWAPPTNEKVEGATAYLRGAAQRGGTSVSFDLRLVADVSVDLDLTQFHDGEPLFVEGIEHYPFDYTVVKIYDRLFDGIEFDDPSALVQLEEHVLQTLAAETTLMKGTRFGV